MKFKHCLLWAPRCLCATLIKKRAKVAPLNTILKAGDLPAQQASACACQDLQASTRASAHWQPTHAPAPGAAQLTTLL